MKKLLLLLLTLPLLSGCPSDSRDGLSEQEVRSLIDPLQSQIVTLQNQVQLLENDLAVTRRSVGDRVSFQRPVEEVSFTDKVLGFFFPALVAETPPPDAIGTLMQYSSSNPARARGLVVKLESQYMAQFNTERVDGGFETFLAHAEHLVYESSDCSASGATPLLLLKDRLSVQAQMQGLVVRDPIIGDLLTVNASTNWYFPPDPIVETVTIGSIKSIGQNLANASCEDRTGQIIALIEDVVRLLPNDPAVTGVPNEVWDGVPLVTGVE